MESRGPNFPDPMAGALCYVLGPVSGALFLYWKRYRENRFVRFHAWQSIFFSIVAVLAQTLCIGATALLPLEYVAWALFAAMGCSLVLMLLWFRAMLQAMNGNEWLLPLAGRFARGCR